MTVFSTVEKALSFFYRIILSRVIGAEGLGLYQITLSVFAVFLTAASSGVPVTVSRLIAKSGAENDRRGKDQAVSAGVAATVMVTVPLAAVLLFGRKLLDLFFTDDRCSSLFLILLPTLILTSVYAVMRGSFWGNRQFLPYSIIELCEDAVMVVLGCILIRGTSDPLTGARGAVIAVAVSYIFSFAVSVIWYLRTGGRFVNPKKQLKPLFASSTPITAMRTSTSVINSVVAIMLPVLLAKTQGLTSSEAISLYGVAVGMSVPILFIPSSLIGSISVVVAPELSENYYRNRAEKVRSDIEKSVQAAVLIAALLIPVIFVLGQDIGDFLYSNALSGMIVRNSAFILLPMCLSMISTTVLNSLNCERRTLLYYFAGAAAMLGCIALLTKPLGVYSYVIGLALSFIITAVLNLRLLSRKCSHIKYLGYTAKASVSAVICCAFGMLLNNILCNYIGAFWRIVVCAPLCLIFSAAFMLCFEMYSFRPLRQLVLRRR